MPNLYVSDDECAGCAHEAEGQEYPACAVCPDMSGSGNWTPSEATIAICKKIIAMGDGQKEGE